ncbi:MAG: hypothetical protein MUO26_02085 [Methanotrichaceae archaeon]|nr:hypothetical protein [Methanotrichaceae archaeon]
MRGVAIAVLIVVLVAFCGIAASMPPLSSMKIYCLIRDKLIAKPLTGEG